MLKLNRNTLPREKLIAKGTSALGDNELLAILIETGSRKNNVIELSDKLLVDSDLGSIQNLSVRELCRKNGIGISKACRILAGIELGKRVILNASRKKCVLSAKEAVSEILSEIRDTSRESLILLLLDKKGHLIARRSIIEGMSEMISFDPAILFREVIRELADGFIIAHNHPSGNANPSEEDILFTKVIKKRSELLDLVFVDHIIIGDSEFTSLREAGIL